jgi:hypothetical protein
LRTLALFFDDGETVRSLCVSSSGAILRGSTVVAAAIAMSPLSSGTGNFVPHLGHVITFPAGSVSATLSLTPQDGQATFLVNSINESP